MPELLAAPVVNKPPPISYNPTVVLLHGLGRGPRSLEKLRRHVEATTGCRTVSIGYPTRPKLEDLAVLVAGKIRAEVGSGSDVFAVTQSMGGVILRLINGLADNGGVKWRGAVMLGPPNNGSSLARTLSQSWGGAFRLICGDSAVALGQHNRKWPLPPRPFGVIAGTKPLYPNTVSYITNAFGLLEGPNDGTICVDETLLDGMDDFRTIHEGHSLLVYNPEVFGCVVKFMETGSFT